MSIAETLLGEFEYEAKTTRKFLENVPENQLKWSPHARSHSAGELALHIAAVPGAIVTMSQADTFALDFGKGWEKPQTVKEILDKLDWSIQTVRQVLPTIPDERMAEIWTGTVDGKPTLTMPRGMLLRFVMLNHWYHHRGQLGVYLRLLGAKVPSSYGPSGDEG